MEQYNTIQFRLMAQKTPQLTQTQLNHTMHHIWHTLYPSKFYPSVGRVAG